MLLTLHPAYPIWLWPVRVVCGSIRGYIPVVPSVPVKKSSKTSNCSNNEFLTTLATNKIICSHILTRGESKGSRCGKNVTEPDQSLPNDCQFCTSHGGKKGTKKVDNSSAIFVPTISEPKTYQQFQQFQPSQDIFFSSLRVNNPISDFFCRKSDDQDIYFNPDSASLFFIKQNGIYKCQGKIDKIVENNGKPLSNQFTSYINHNYLESELKWLTDNNITYIESE